MPLAEIIKVAVVKVVKVKPVRAKCLCGCGATPEGVKKYLVGHRAKVWTPAKPKPGWSVNKKDTPLFGKPKQYRRFGLTKDQAMQLFVSQGSKCGSCPRTEPAHNQGWCVDHDHVTLQVRGIICSPCNKFIGMTYDPLTGERDNLLALDASYTNARQYLVNASSSKLYIDLEKNKSAEEVFIQKMYEQQKEADTNTVLFKQRWKNVRAKLGGVIFMELESEQRKTETARLKEAHRLTADERKNTRQRERYEKTERDIETMSARVSMHRNGIAFGPTKEDIEECLLNNVSWRKMAIKFDMPAGTIQSRAKRFGIIYKRVSKWVIG